MTIRAVFFEGSDQARLIEVQRLRKRIFVDLSGWDLRVEDDREVDQFDQRSTVHLVMYDGSVPCATFRATRSDRPYLAADVFPTLAVTSAYPHRPDVWEISRFGIVPTVPVPDLARNNYALMFYFARRVGATSLVAIADLTYERFLRSLGIRTRRFGPPLTIGTDAAGRPLRVVAGEIPLAQQEPARLAPLRSLTQAMEIIDASEIFGPARVSA